MLTVNQYNDVIKLIDGNSKTLFLNRLHVINDKSKRNYQTALQNLKTIRAAFTYAYQRQDEPRFSQLHDLLSKFQKDIINLS